MVLVLLATTLAAGCGDGSLAARTTPLLLETQVSPRQYLADTVAAADAVRQFSDALATVGPRPAPAALERAAREMEDPLVAGRRLLDRLEAARLEDHRLERQRERVAEALGDVVAAMERTRDAAVVGDPARAAQESRGFASAVARLRALPES